MSLTMHAPSPITQPATSSRLIGPRLALILAVLLLLTWIGGVWLRTGLVPASSSGNEVWFSESAYWLLHDGQLRRDMHADDIGSAVRDFLPPIPALGQAISFRLLGMSQFSMGVAASVVATGIVATLVALARGLGLPMATAVFAGIAFAFVPISSSLALRVRYENWLVLFWMAALLFTLVENSRRSRLAQATYPFAGGLCFAAACFSYYAYGPTLLILFTGILALRLARGSGIVLPLSFAGGAIACTAVFLLWVGADLGFFLDQNLSQIRKYSWVETCRATPTKCLGVSGDPNVLICVAGLVGAVLILVAVVLGDIRARVRFSARHWLWILIALLAVASWMQSLINYPRFILFATTLMVLLIIYRMHLLPDSPTVKRVGTGALAVLAMVSTGLVLAADYRGLVVERSAREYAVFAEKLLAASNLDGLVLTDEPGWLAYRGVTKAGQLHHLIPLMGDPSELNRSRILFDTSMASRVTTIAINPGQLAAYREQMPMVDAALRRPAMQEPVSIGITPGPYRVDVYTVARPERR